MSRINFHQHSVIVFVPAFHPFRLGVPKSSHQPIQQALVSRRASAVAAPIDLIPLLAGTKENGFLLFFCEFSPGLVQRDLQVFEHLPMEDSAHRLFILIDHADGFQRALS